MTTDPTPTETAPENGGERLTEAQRINLAAAVKDSFYEARDNGRTMHQAAEDDRIAAAVEQIVAAHVTAALAEVERRIESAPVRTDSAERWGLITALHIVRAYRQERADD